MKLNLKHIIIVCAMVLTIAASVRADVTVKMQGSMSSAAMGQQDPQQAAVMGRMMRSTIYISGNKMRMDTAFAIMIMDYDDRKMYKIDPNAGTYSATDMSAASLAQLSGGMMAMITREGGTVSVKGTGSVVKILGYPCREFDLHVSMGGASSPSINGRIYATTALPDSFTAAMAAYAKQAGYGGKVKGFPLKTVMHVTTPGGVMTISEIATSVSTAAIPSSEFKVPTAYTLTQSSVGHTGMGMGMGMPGQ